MKRFDHAGNAIQSPWTRKWVHQCGACGRVGVRPEAPERFTRDPRRGASLRRTIGVLALDARGLCELCAELA